MSVSQDTLILINYLLYCSGFGAMNKSQSQCYRCGRFYFPSEIIPPKRRGRGNRGSRLVHSCTAPNCFNRDRTPGGMYPCFFLLLISSSFAFLLFHFLLFHFLLLFLILHLLLIVFKAAKVIFRVHKIQLTKLILMRLF